MESVQEREGAAGKVRWREVGLFLGLTFGLTYLLNLGLWFAGGLENPATLLALQLQMLLPAFVAIVLGMFAFGKGSVIGYLKNQGRPRWFYTFFIVFTLVYAGLAAAALAAPDLIPTIGLVTLALTLLSVLVLVVLRFASGGEAFARFGLGGGKKRYWLIFGLGFVLYYVSQTALNYAFGLGQQPDLAAMAAQARLPADAFLAAGAVQTVLVGPFLGIVIAFGEEYGWRGYLQGELVKLGRVKGVLLLGIIWGLWHAPMIAMGYNYPGEPVLGIVLMTAYTVLLGFVLGYVMLRTGSVLLVAYLHALNNQVFSFLVGIVYQPESMVFSFGAGIYGLAVLAVIVLLILRDPIWRGRGTPLASASQG